MKSFIYILLLLVFTSCSVYRFFPKTFEGEIAFQCDFRDSIDLEKLIIADNEPYHDSTVTFHKEMVSIDPLRGLVLKCQKQSENTFKAGLIRTWNHDTTLFAQTGGTWIFNAIFPDSWAAIWLLHPDYFVPQIDKNHIIPEIDLAENNGGKIDNCVHYGFNINKPYNDKSRVRKMQTPDGLLHEYAMEIKERGYNFYLDGKLKNRMRSSDPEFVVDQPFYMIINNAWSNRHPMVDTEFNVKSIKVLK